MSQPLTGPFGMKDFPIRLRLNAMSCELARSIYQATCDVYAPASTPFEDLEPRVKDRYIEVAQRTIQSLQPRAPVVDLSESVFQLGVVLNLVQAGETTETK